MRVRDWMSPDPLSIGPAASVGHAGEVMATYGIRHLPVVMNGRVVGVLSDRDVRSAPPERTVGSAMSAPPHVINAEGSVEQAARMMLSRRISALPVIDAEGYLVGMITTTDCLLASLSSPASV